MLQAGVGKVPAVVVRTSVSGPRRRRRRGAASGPHHRPAPRRAARRAGRRRARPGGRGGGRAASPRARPRPASRPGSGGCAADGDARARARSWPPGSPSGSCWRCSSARWRGGSGWPTGVPFELPSATFVAAVLSLVVALLAVAVVARPTLREPISTLLRRVPPRRAGWAVGVVDAVVVAVAAAGLVTLLSGNLSGPLALATPTLIALALGLVLAHVLIPLADTNARRLTARGRVVGGLTAVQVARRPAVRRIMAIITVATALTVFATDALVVGARNREDRAKVETGAEAVITTSPTDVNVAAQRGHRRRSDGCGRHAGRRGPAGQLGGDDDAGGRPRPVLPHRRASPRRGRLPLDRDQRRERSGDPRSPDGRSP